jgi:hypothetical protein
LPPLEEELLLPPDELEEDELLLPLDELLKPPEELAFWTGLGLELALLPPPPPPQAESVIASATTRQYRRVRRTSRLPQREFVLLNRAPNTLDEVVVLYGSGPMYQGSL